MQTMDIRTFETELTRDTTTDGTMRISGYAAVFDQPAQADSFVEYMKPTALDGVDLSGVLLLYAHNADNILARADSKTLTTKVDKHGLYFEAELPDTTLGHDTYTNIQAGNIKGCSIGFVIAPGGDSWDTVNGQTTHTITQIESLGELSLTPIPAYTETSVTVKRDLENFKEAKNLAEKNKEAEAPAEDAKAEPEQAPEASKAEAPKDPEPAKDAPAEPADKPAEDPEDGSDIADLKSEIDSLREELEALTSAPEEERDENGAEEAPKDTKAEEPAEDNADAKPASEEGDKEDMAKTITELDKKSAEERDLEAFLKTGKVEHRDAAGFTSAEGEAVLPMEVLDVLKQPEDPSQLSGYVNKVQVSAATGKLPVLKRATAQLATAEELAENPAIANATIDKVTYDVNTYRGQLPISMEMAQDYGNITSLLAQYVQTVKDQTEQHKIGAVLAQATPVAASSVDDIKDAYNTGLTNYGADRMFVISESLFAELDKAKDNDGRYLLQDSIASSTGKTLLGANVVIVPDDVLGAAGNKVGFVGSVKAFVLEAIRAQVSLNWTRNEQFEQILGVAFRADFEVADKDAGKFITYTPSKA